MSPQGTDCYLPEESYLYRYLNSDETLNFFGNLFQISPEKRQDRSEQLLEMVVSNSRSRQVGEFSKACSGASASPRR